MYHWLEEEKGMIMLTPGLLGGMANKSLISE